MSMENWLIRQKPRVLVMVLMTVGSFLVCYIILIFKLVVLVQLTVEGCVSGDGR